jgi:membrane-associated protease RseP (regulator of RpoE activity)
MNTFQLVLLVIEEIFTKYPFEVAGFVLFLHSVLAIHEGSHAIVGALCGVRSTGIRIGDKPLFTIPVLGYKITVGWLPSSGHTTFVDEEKLPDTWQVFVTYLAGPLSVICAGPLFYMLCRDSHFFLAVSLGALFSVCGIYDLRKNCPDGAAIRRLWKVLRARGNTMGSMEM